MTERTPHRATHSLCIKSSCFFWILILYLIPCSSMCSSNGGQSLCSVSMDAVFGGKYVDCSHRNMSHQDLKRLAFDDVTSLVISYNNFTILPNNSFTNLKKLRSLECVQCNLSLLQVNALWGLAKLEILDLRTNRLSLIQRRFPAGFFHHTPHLKKLFIGDNHNNGKSLNYSSFIDIFQSLPELTDLDIDGLRNLRIGSEFTRLKNLNYLKIYSRYIRSISNDSLEGFQNSSVKEFVLSFGGVPESNLGLNVFQYLPNVSRLVMDRLQVGNHNFLRMMEPLQGKTLDYIQANRVVVEFTVVPVVERVQDLIVTEKLLEYLTNICVSEFVWIDSQLFSFANEAILSPTWRRCLRSMVIYSDKRMVLDYNILENCMKPMEKLETIAFKMSGRKLIYKFWIDDISGENDKSEGRNFENERHHSQDPVSSRKNSIYGIEDIAYNNRGGYSTPNKTIVTSDFISDMETYSPNDVSGETDDTPSELIEGTNITDMTISHEEWAGGKPMEISDIIYPPTSLHTYVIDGSYSYWNLYTDKYGKNNLRTITISNCEERYGAHLTGKILGLDYLETFNFQGSRLTIAPDHFDSFPSLKNLILRKTQESPGYIEFYGQRLLESIIYLEYLDVSDNGLRTFPNNKFRNLKYLCLSKNYFSSIPFHFSRTTKLEILDLRGNIFVDLTADEREAVDGQIRSVHNFSILFANNQVSCACTSLPFLAWLQSRQKHFDREGNYSCMSEDGRLSNTASYQDLRALWRQCHGHFYLMLSLTLAITLVAFYLGVFLVLKNRIQMISNLRQILVPGFRLQTRENFRFDVCLGYADQDVVYVRKVLLRYLEEMWHLRTFVHHRDLLQDPLLMSEAIRDSWRCVLLITEHFLYQCHMAHNVMKVATFFVNPTNPKSLIVMVEESVQHQIPDYVLHVVDEDNIIVLTQIRGFLSYEAKETLKNRLSF